MASEGFIFLFVLFEICDLGKGPLEEPRRAKWVFTVVHLCPSKTFSSLRLWREVASLLSQGEKGDGQEPLAGWSRWTLKVRCWSTELGTHIRPQRILPPVLTYP